MTLYTYLINWIFSAETIQGRKLEGVPKRSRLGYTVYYAGSEQKIKIREIKFSKILIVFLEISFPWFWLYVQILHDIVCSPVFIGHPLFWLLFSRISIETKSDEETKDVIIQLSQRDSRSLLMDNKETLIIGFTVLKVEFNRKYRLHQFSEEQIVNKSDYIKSKVGH